MSGQRILALLDRIMASTNEHDIFKWVQQIRDITDGKTLTDFIKRPLKEFYTMGEFLAAIYEKTGRSYGWKKDYVLASETTPNCIVTKSDTIGRWQHKNRVPAWAYEQIEKLNFPDRKGWGEARSALLRPR
jgi:hypothetical protein